MDKFDGIFKKRFQKIAFCSTYSGFIPDGQRDQIDRLANVTYRYFMEEKAPKALSIDEQLALIASVFFVLQGPIRRIPNIGSRYRGGKGRTDTFGKVSRQIEKKLRSLQFSISKTENHSILLNAILNSLKQKAT
ncbi:MAG: hypothetical protein LW852_12325, partial [Sediminibacterium sp.]|nr:hypothetical protein [Sediminibacterium sp.]